MLSKEGIDKLEAIMLANGQYVYDQETFGEMHGCNTTLCAAGFARLLEVGEKFNQEIESDTFPETADKCTLAGIRLLGIEATVTIFPQIFDYSRRWPGDIYQAYVEAETPQQRIAVYINMLRTRANDDGSIREAE